MTQLPSPVGPNLSLPGPVTLSAFAGIGSSYAQNINATVAAGTTIYSGPGASTLSSPVSTRHAPVVQSVQKTLTIRTTNAQPAGQTLTVTLFRNGVATTLSLVVPANSAAGVFTVNNPIGEVFSNGDLLAVEFTQQAGASASATIAGWSLGTV